MACAQQMRTLKQESRLSPNQVVTEQQSFVVIKKLLAIAVSGITYLRGIFPGKAYGKKYVDDQQVMILRDEPSCPGAIQILQWMQGCFDAIQKKYLRTVIMTIYTDPEKPQKVTETYQFKIQYSMDGAQMDFESSNSKVSMSCGSTKTASIMLVRKLYTVMQNLGPLPENVGLSMKLAYYDDVTPQDYQPAGFKEADFETVEFELEPVNLAMGEVVTPFHSLKLNMTTERHRLEQLPCFNPDDHKPKAVAEAGKEETDNAEIQMCNNNKVETREVVTEMDTLAKTTSDTEEGVKRTRSGRLIKSTAATNVTVKTMKKTSMKAKVASQYYIPNSQESAITNVAKKKRKFSHPKERY